VTPDADMHLIDLGATHETDVLWQYDFVDKIINVIKLAKVAPESMRVISASGVTAYGMDL